MQQSFEYVKVQTAMDSITLEDSGNTILKANNDVGLEWYLYIKSDLGYSVIKEFGPVFRELDVSINSFTFSMERKEYNEKYITKRINNFLNLGKREITQVHEIDEMEYNGIIDSIKTIL